MNRADTFLLQHTRQQQVEEIKIYAYKAVRLSGNHFIAGLNEYSNQLRQAKNGVNKAIYGQFRHIEPRLKSLVRHFWSTDTDAPRFWLKPMYALYQGRAEVIARRLSRQHGDYWRAILGYCRHF